MATAAERSPAGVVSGATRASVLAVFSAVERLFELVDPRRERREVGRSAPRLRRPISSFSIRWARPESAGVCAELFRRCGSLIGVLRRGCDLRGERGAGGIERRQAASRRPRPRRSPSARRSPRPRSGLRPPPTGPASARSWNSRQWRARRRSPRRSRRPGRRRTGPDAGAAGADRTAAAGRWLARAQAAPPRRRSRLPLPRGSRRPRSRRGRASGRG